MAFSIGADQADIPGLHGDELRLGRADVCELVQRHLRAVGIDRHAVEHVHRRAPGAGGGHLLAEIFHCLVHAGLELSKTVLQRGNCRHRNLSHMQFASG